MRGGGRTSVPGGGRAASGTLMQGGANLRKRYEKLPLQSMCAAERRARIGAEVLSAHAGMVPEDMNLRGRGAAARRSVDGRLRCPL